jgi:hypothetical protein
VFENKREGGGGGMGIDDLSWESKALNLKII